MCTSVTDTQRSLHSFVLVHRALKHTIQTLQALPFKQSSLSCRIIADSDQHSQADPQPITADTEDAR